MNEALGVVAAVAGIAVVIGVLASIWLVVRGRPPQPTPSGDVQRLLLLGTAAHSTEDCHAT